MPKRSLSAISLTFHTANVRKERQETFAPSQLNGENLLDLFEECCKDPKAIPLMEGESNECLKLKSVERCRRNALLVDAYSGKSGESGAVYSPNQDEPVYQIAEDEAPTGHTRALLYVPESGETAIFFSEHCQRGNAGSRLMKGFSPFFRLRMPGITMQKERILEGSEWIESIKSIRDIEVRTHSLPSKTSEAVRDSEGFISLSIKPKKSKRFSPTIFQIFRDNASMAGSIIGFPILDEAKDADVFATVEGKDGRTKKINVQNDFDAPRLYKTLSEISEPELSDDLFIEACIKEASGILEKLGEM